MGLKRICMTVVKKPHSVLSLSFDIVKSSIIHESKNLNLEPMSGLILAKRILYFPILSSHIGKNSSLKEAVS